MTAMRRARRQMHAQQTNDATERNRAPRRDATLYPYKYNIQLLDGLKFDV